jgi:hypothetical protein
MSQVQRPGESQTWQGRDRNQPGRSRISPRDDKAPREEALAGGRAADSLRNTEVLDESGAPNIAPSAHPQWGPDEWEVRVRCRAYERYLARNGADGDADSDWREAERELREADGGPRDR